MKNNNKGRSDTSKKRMGLKARIMIALAGISLIPLYFIPFWTIDMQAPQYPEGIGMYIHIDDVTGHKANDIQSINTLNHYIGMKEIHASDFPEFEIMPWIFGAIILTGIVAAATGHFAIVWVWVGMMALVSIGGFVDFYMWTYDYGHNLSPDAAIKIPGMSYQPPLLGCKQLLNINACSWPWTGSIFVSLSVLFAGFTFWFEKKQNSAV